MGSEQEKRAAAEAAADLAEHGMTVGLGTGTTVAYLLPALAARRLRIRCVATSPATESAARRLGLEVVAFDGIPRLDLAIDGADQVAPDRWLIKGGGGAHTREKTVAAAAERFVVIVSADKMVDRLAPPVPLELMAFGLDSTLGLLGKAELRRGAPPSPDLGVIADWLEDFDDAAELSARLAAVPGLVGHGLFPPSLVSDVIVGGG
jgi:ribose 5-phosphate isomerase A